VEEHTLTTQVEAAQREVVLVEDAHVRTMMGIEVLEPVPARNVPYERSDPYILVHEATVPINPERAKLDTTHPHRGFDNLWDIISGVASTGHSTGPDGAFERAQLETGGLLKIRSGRGVYHAESIGEDELREGKTGEFRSVLFWVNLARKEKHVEPTAQPVHRRHSVSRTPRYRPAWNER
jgi:redox-sensitive bicupin YhaK (pirin superfamily)